MNILLVGIQGSGKGSLVLELTKYLDFSVVSVGQLLRDEVSTGSALGKAIKEKQDKGLLVDTPIVVDIIKKKLKNNADKIMIFDGFPRNIEQAHEFDKTCKLDLLVHLKLSKKEALNRILNRVTCSLCGNITTIDLAKDLICPHCGGKLTKRIDDSTLDSIENRFSKYETESFPLIEYYKNKANILEIDASKTIEQICRQVLKVISDYNKK